MSKTQGKLRGKHNDPYYVAQDILSRRDHSVHELTSKLRQKSFSAADIASVVTWLSDKQWLDDHRVAAGYIDAILRAKAVGPRWLQYKLRQRGIAPSVIEETLGAVFTSDTERELVQRAADTWRDRHSKHRDDTPRLQRFLISRGFSFEAINSVA